MPKVFLVPVFIAISVLAVAQALPANLTLMEPQALGLSGPALTSAPSSHAFVSPDSDEQNEHAKQSSLPPKKGQSLQLAGGASFMMSKMQLTEYGFGTSGQVRYRFGPDFRENFALLADISVYPSRRAAPVDDRPFQWSSLWDSLDERTGQPLSWHRGTRRGTASLGFGLEYAPLPWLFAQVLGGLEVTFQQEEDSHALKNPMNQFEGFDLYRSFFSSRFGLRKAQLEIFVGVLATPENRPFTYIPANDIGGSHYEKWDPSYYGGMMMLF